MNGNSTPAKIGSDQAIKLLIDVLPRWAPPTGMNSCRVPPSTGVKSKSCKARGGGDLRSRFAQHMLTR